MGSMYFPPPVFAEMRLQELGADPTRAEHPGKAIFDWKPRKKSEVPKETAARARAWARGVGVWGSGRKVLWKIQFRWVPAG